MKNKNEKTNQLHKRKKKFKSAKLTFKSRYSGHKIKITSKKTNWNKLWNLILNKFNIKR
jgi:hypothetical protein